MLELRLVLLRADASGTARHRRSKEGAEEAAGRRVQMWTLTWRATSGAHGFACSRRNGIYLVLADNDDKKKTTEKTLNKWVCVRRSSWDDSLSLCTRKLGLRFYVSSGERRCTSFWTTSAACR